MRLCMKMNATIVNMAMPDSSFIDYNERTKKFSGAGGRVLVDSFLLMRKRENQDDFFKNCELYVMPEDGRLLPNGSYGRNTVVGMLERSLADFTIKVENMYVDPRVVDMSRVFAADDLLLSHYINGTKETNSKFLNYDQIVDIFVPSKSIFFEFVCLVLCSFLFGLTLQLMRKRRRRIPFDVYCINFFHLSDRILRQPRSPLSYLLLFNLLFFFLTKHFLANHINVNKVVVNKEVLLYDIPKIIETDKEICLLMRNKDSDYWEQSNPGSLAHILFYNKTRDPNHPCIIFDGNGLNSQLSNFFLVGILLHHATLRTLNSIYNMEIFANPKPLASLNSVIYLSKKMSRQVRAEIDKWSDIYIEQGYSIKWVYDSYEELKKTFPVKTPIYTSVDDFVNRNSFIDDLAYEKFKVFLYFYLAFTGLYTAIGILHFAHQKIERERRKRFLRSFETSFSKRRFGYRRRRFDRLFPTK